MFAMMAMMSTSGLMVTSQMAVFAEDFGISQAVVFGMAALPLALTIDRFYQWLNPAAVWVYFRPLRPRANHVYRLCAGGGSDDALAGVPGRSAAVCPALRGGVLWLGETLALPVDAHRYVRQRACRQQLWLAVISQGIGSIFGGPLAALLYQHTHGWHVVFSCAIGLDFVTAALALWVLKPCARALSASIANRPPGRSDGSPVTSLIFATQQRVQVLIAPLAFKKRYSAGNAPRDESPALPGV